MKPAEVNASYMADLHIIIEAWNENERVGWEQTRLICFYIGRFGNSDPKKFPSSIKRMMPLPWDKQNAAIDVKDMLTIHAERMARRKLFEGK